MEGVGSVRGRDAVIIKIIIYYVIHFSKMCQISSILEIDVFILRNK